MRGSVRVGVLFALLSFLGSLAGALAAQQVTLPLAQFEALRARTRAAPEAEPAPPAPLAFEAADIAIAAGNESARIVQKLELTLYADGWQKVPLGEAGSFIAARFGDLEGRVEVDDKGWALQVRGQGRHSVTLESAVPLRRDETATRPTWQLAFHLPPAAVVRGRIETAPGIEEVGLGGPGLARREGAGSWSFVAVPTPEPLSFTLRGTRTLPERAQLPLRFEATSATAATLSRTRLRVHAWIEARVAQGRLPELRIPLPAGFDVVTVTGPTAGWNVENGALVITPLEPVETSLAAEVELTARPETAFASPLLAPAESRRTLFLTRAALQGDGLLTLAEPGAVRPATDAEALPLPEEVRKAAGRLLAVLDPQRPPRWQAEWADHLEVLAAQVDRLLVDVAVGTSGRASYQLWAEVRNRGAQQLVVRLPAGFELTAGTRDDEPIIPGITPGTAPAGGLSVPLSSGEGSQVVYLGGLLPLSLPRSGGFDLPLPALSAPAARVEVRLVLPGGRDYELADRSRTGSVQGPPGDKDRIARRNAILSANTISQQIQVSPGAAPATGGFFLFVRPPGFSEIQAVWSALSPSPAPLGIRIEVEKEDHEWF